MKQTYLGKIIFLALLLLPLMTVFAGVPAWQINPTQSSLSFTGTQNNAPVSGKFKSFSGEINFDPEQLNSSHVRIVVDLNSVSTSYKDVEDALKTADWFNVKLFPKAIFKADQFTKTGDNAYQANGTLKIRDKEIPISVAFVVLESSNNKARVKGTTVVKRSLFGIGQGEWASTDEVKDEVKVDFDIIAVKK